MEKKFYDNGFRAEARKQIFQESVCETKFMTVAEISFHSCLCFMIIQLSMKLFTRFLFHFIDSNPQLHGTVIASINALRFYAPEHLKTNKHGKRLFLLLLVEDCVN